MKTEIQKLFKNKGLVMAMLVILLIPFVYSFFFLTSAWDPYGNTGKIPVAVVNEDQPATLQGTKISAGADTIKELKNDHQLSWKFVTAKQAADGLKKNKFYTVVTIPKDFSKNAATVLDANPKPMKLEYETNGSLNYISEVISQVGTDKLNDQIKEKVSTAFVSQLFGKIKDIGSKLKLAADGSKKIKDGLGVLDGGLKQYTNGVVQVNDGIGQLHGKVPVLASGIGQLANGGDQLYGGLGQLNGQIPALSDGVTRLNDGGLQLKDGLGQLNGKVPELTDGVNRLTDGLNQVHGSVAPNKEGKETLSSGVMKLAQGISDLKYYTLEAQKGEGSLKSNLPGGISLLREKMNKLADTISAQVSQLNGLPMTLMNNSDPVNNGAISDAKNSFGELSSLIEGTDNEELKAKLAEFSKAYNKQTNNTNMYVNIANKTISTIKYNLTNTASDKVGDPTGLQAAIAQFQSALKTLDNELNNPSESGHPAYSDAVEQLNDGLAKLNESVNIGSESTPSLVSAMTQLSDGMNQLHGQTPILAEGVSKLFSGSNQLSDGLVELHGKVPSLSAGVGLLYNGSAKLKNGLNELNGNVPALSDGVNKLNNGTNQLVANNGTLLSGVGKLSDGSGTLADGLQDGYEQVIQTKLTNSTAKMFANPTKLSQKRLSTVPNYGAALAPFVLAMALFIGIIIFNFAYSLHERPTNREERINWIKTKLLVGTGFAIASAALEAFLIRLIGLNVNNLLAFYGIAILFGISAMYVTMLFNLLFGRAGIFIALGLLTLSGSGGLFPMETVAPWFVAIQKFLPMTYAMNGFRSSITGGIVSTTVSQSVMILIVVSVLSLIAMLGLTLVKLNKETNTQVEA